MHGKKGNVINENCRVAISRTARVHFGTSCDRRRNSEISGRGAREGRRARREGRRTLFIRFIPRRRRNPFVRGTEAIRVSIYLHFYIINFSRTHVGTTCRFCITLSSVRFIAPCCVIIRPVRCYYVRDDDDKNDKNERDGDDDDDDDDGALCARLP